MRTIRLNYFQYPIQVYGAAGGAISTLPDMAIYMKYLVDHKETPWVKEASQILFTDQEDDENIGYLWQDIDYAEKEGYYYSKTGTSNGIQSGVYDTLFLTINPVNDIPVFCMVYQSISKASL